MNTERSVFPWSRAFAFAFALAFDAGSFER